MSQHCDIRRPRWLPFASLAIMIAICASLIVWLICLLSYVSIGLQLPMGITQLTAIIVLLIATIASPLLLIAAVFSAAYRLLYCVMASITFITAASIAAAHNMEACVAMILLYLVGAVSMIVNHFACRRYDAINDDQIYLRYYRERQMCWNCGYSLRGLPTPRCPECGVDITPSVGKTDDANLAE